MISVSCCFRSGVVKLPITFLKVIRRASVGSSEEPAPGKRPNMVGDAGLVVAL